MATLGPPASAFVWLWSPTCYPGPGSQRTVIVRRKTNYLPFPNTLSRLACLPLPVRGCSSFGWNGTQLIQEIVQSNSSIVRLGAVWSVLIKLCRPLLFLCIPGPNCSRAVLNCKDNNCIVSWNCANFVHVHVLNCNSDNCDKCASWLMKRWSCANSENAKTKN